VRRTRLVWGLLGYCVVVVACLYFALVVSISQPVHWDQVATLTLFFAPCGLMAAGFPTGDES
jgi:flagellar biosynthesis protein FliQ